MESLKYSRLIEFFNAANAYIKGNEERSTMTFALNKLIMFYRKKIENIQRDWQDEVNTEVDEIRVKYCEKDKDTGVFKEKTYGEGGNLVIKKVFTADNERKADKEILAKSREIETKWMDYDIIVIKTHIVPIPATLDISWITVFNDFIFDPLNDDDLQKHYLAQSKKDILELLPE